MDKFVLHSDKIKVFPFGSKRSTDPLARVLNEQNIISIVTSVVDNKNYVISYDNNIVEFVIQGYIFSIDLTDFTDITRDSPIFAYANITVDPVTGYTYLTGNDTTELDVSVFNGLTLTSMLPSEDEVSLDSVLQLLDTDGEDWYVPDESQLTINVKRVASVTNAGSSIKSDFDQINNDVEEMSEDIDNLTQRTGNIETALNYINPIVSALDGRNNNNVSTFYDVIYCGTATDLID